MPVKIVLRKDQIVRDSFYKNGSVVEVESNLAQYLLGMNEAYLAGDDTPVSPEPTRSERPDAIMEHLKKIAQEAKDKENATQMSLADMIAAAVNKGVKDQLEAMGIKPKTPEELAEAQRLAEEKSVDDAAKLIEKPTTKSK